ncbi:hypothetical protein ACIHFD_63450 [Nonomuraea sp. NPDC051941]|uniref:hypothetical protein n=1 Tax=Nonomuraea sp. NPDC051941 TaxID=3364373 RepID=UPI0037C764D9
MITFERHAAEPLGTGTAVMDLHFCEEPRSTTAVEPSMTGVLRAAGVLAGTSSPAREEALRDFRAGWYACLGARADALFELTDAALSAPAITTLPYLSLEPVFRRGWGSLYGALADGVVTAEKVRDLLVTYRFADWPLTFAIDASTHPRPYAATSPEREWHHLSGPGGVDGAVPGWAWQHLTQLNLDHDSWVAPMDVVRVAAGGPAQTLAALDQVRGMATRLRERGEGARKLFVFDAGYDLAVLADELHGEADVTGEHEAHCATLPAGAHHQLCGVHIVEGNHDLELLVRVRNDRMLYRDPPPRPAGNGGRPGRPRRHGSELSCARPGTWGEPGRRLETHDDQYGQVSVHVWAGLHPKLAGKDYFADRAEAPILTGTLIRVQVERLPGGRRPTPKPMWLFWSGDGEPDLERCWRSYLRRFDIEHFIKFLKSVLGWVAPALRHPAQAERWTWILLTAYTQLGLARHLAQDQHYAWERRRRRLSPGRVRRDFARLLPILGTPARPPKSSKAGPGRPKGHTSTPARRHPVPKKATA